MKRSKLIYRCDFLFGLTLLLKIFSGGITYFATLDDYIQYGSYPLFDPSYVFFEIGTVSARPLASLLDPTLWGAFRNRMWVALLLISVVYFFACLLLDRILTDEGIKITPVLYAVCLLLPLTFEGTYWISASSRVVVGLFFAVLSVRFLQAHFKSKNNLLLLPYAVCCFLSFGFYESVMIFSGLLQLFVLVKYAVGQKAYRKLWLMAIPAVGAISLLMYYKLASELGALGSRASGFSLSGMGHRFADFLSQFGYIFSAGLIRTTVNGFIDGFRVLFASPVWGLSILAAIIILSAGCAYLSRKHKLRAKVNLCVPLGLCLTFLPLLPNLLVPDVWLTYRSIAICIPGLCVLLAPLAAHLLQNRYARMAVIFAMVFVFSVGCVNEVATYKKVNELDNRLLDEVISHLDEEVLSGEKNTLLVLPHEIAAEQTSYYKDHVKSVFYTDWSLTGAVRAKTKNNAVKNITPVYSLDGVDTEGKLILYMDTTYHVTEEQYE